MRDRLIELIQQKQECGWRYTDDEYTTDVFNFELADYLLANGVIVPPCKVGDVVYRVSRYWNSYKLKWEFNISDEGIAFAEPNLVFTSSKGNVFFERDIGKTVFLAKEEAERVLKGGVTDTNVGSKTEKGGEQE